MNRGGMMDRFIAYIEEALHLSVDVSKYEKLNTLPLYLRNSYELYTMSVHNTDFLLMQPKEQSNLTVLRKQAGQLKKLTGLNNVLCLEDVRAYTKEKMLSEGISFVITGKQVYMPFLGIVLSNNEARTIPNTEQLSFSSQRLLLTAIYQRWKQKSLTETAHALSVSKMSITRCFDELQSLALDMIKDEGKKRLFIWLDSRRDLWEAVRPLLKNPVSKQYRIGEQIKIIPKKLGGMSAVCHYSMLGDNPYTVYAVSRKEAKALELINTPLIPDAESPVMVIQVMHYDLDYGNALAIDPLSAILSLTDEDKKDPRVETAIEEILEDVLHD
jgi:hypothetical protein